MNDGLYIDTYGTKHWYLNDKLHRTDGPAVEFKDGNKQWCINGELHRTDGPAIEYSDGTKIWYMNYTQTKDLCVSTFHRLLQRERLTAFLFKVRNWSLNPDILYIILTSSPFCLFFMSLTSHKLKTCVFYVPSYKVQT